MPVRIKPGTGETIFAEIQEFGTFGIDAQRYICRSLDVAFLPDVTRSEWARDVQEEDDISAQKHIYELLPEIRAAIPGDDGFVDAEAFLFPLIALSTFDVTCGPISTFAEYRFLYERLLGARVRPWLPSAFLAAAASPHFPAELREALVRSARGALSSRWSSAEPLFRPEWLGHEALAA